MSSKGIAWDRGYAAGKKTGPVEYRNPFSAGYSHDRYKEGFQAGRVDRGKIDAKARNAKRRGLI